MCGFVEGLSGPVLGAPQPCETGIRFLSQPQARAGAPAPLPLCRDRRRARDPTPAVDAERLTLMRVRSGRNDGGGSDLLVLGWLTDCAVPSGAYASRGGR